MYKILAVSPISIAGALIIKGLAKGFENLGHQVLFYDVRELDKSEIKKFNPDFIIGYDYLHFVLREAEEIISSLNKPVIHYFADAPDSNFSLSGDKSLIDKLQSSNNTVFCWDKSYLDFFKSEAYYLPLGVDPDLYVINEHKFANIPEIAFVGRPLTDIRINILVEIIKKFPDKLGIYSYKKHFDSSVEQIKAKNLLNESELNAYINCYRGFLETEKDLAEVYSRAKILLNITMDQGLNSMNYRVFEALACEGFLLTDYKKDTAEYFKDGIDLVFYNNTENLLENIGKYLQDDTLQKEIALNGKNNILMNHTFTQRAKYIIDCMKMKQ